MSPYWITALVPDHGTRQVQTSEELDHRSLTKILSRNNLTLEVNLRRARATDHRQSPSTRSRAARATGKLQSEREKKKDVRASSSVKCPLFTI